MEKNKKIVILAVLLLIAVIVWIPKGKREAKDLTPPTPATVATKIAQLEITGPRERTRFKEWGRNPFIWPSEAEAVALELFGIVWDEEAPYALINEEVVHTGDKISGKTVIRIEPNKVTLSDGVTEKILQLE